MRKIKTLLFIVSMFCFAGAYAQGVDLRIDSVLTGSGSTLFIDSTYTDTVKIFNDSATDFIGLINIGASINGVRVDTSSSGPVFYSNDTALDTVPAHGYISHALVINTHDPSFIVGTSGVVIWPIAITNLNNATVYIPDSLRETLTILPVYGVGIDELSERDLKVYMSGQQLMIQDNGNYPLKDVRLYDATGKLLLQKPLTVSGFIDMDNYANGVYIAEINFADNTRAVAKLVHTR